MARAVSHPKLPRGVVRDLLGIARALYAHWSATGAAPERLAALEEVGRELARVLELSRLHPDSLGHRAAWSRAERAVARLGELIGEHEALGPVVAAAVGRVRKGAVAQPERWRW